MTVSNLMNSTSFYIVSDFFLSNPPFDSFEISKGLRLSRIPLHWARAQWPHETSHVQHEPTIVIKRLRGWRVGSDVPRPDPSRCIYDTWDEKRWKVKCDFFWIFICQAWETTWIHRSLRCSKIWILQESNSHFVQKELKEFPQFVPCVSSLPDQLKWRFITTWGTHRV